MLAALCHLTITQVRLGQVGSVLDIGFSSCAVPTSYHSPGILYMTQNLDPRVLRLGSARLRARRQGEGVRDRQSANLK